MMSDEQISEERIEEILNRAQAALDSLDLPVADKLPSRLRR